MPPDKLTILEQFFHSEIKIQLKVLRENNLEMKAVKMLCDI